MSKRCRDGLHVEPKGIARRVERCSVCGSDMSGPERPRKPEPPRRLPLSFQDATWHGTTPVDEHIGCLGLSLAVGDGVVRFALPLESAHDIVETLQDYLSASSISVHSESSSGNPNPAESTPEAGVSVCPPQRFHMAAVAE